MTAEPLPISTPSQIDHDRPLPLRVPVVDDDREAGDTAAEVLDIYGADTGVRYCGADAISDIAELRPDARILDLTMPGLNGRGEPMARFDGSSEPRA